MTTHSLSFGCFLALALLATAPACGGGAKVGEACDTPGSVDECAAGICVSNGSSAGAVCRVVCSDSSGCAVGEECNGVEGSTQKACRVKSTK